MGKVPMEGNAGPRRRSPRLLALGPGGGSDLISALPDDLLLLVLARLPCAGAAARTGVLSRRWRGLWARLRRIAFRDVAFPKVEAALGLLPHPPPALSFLQICVLDKQRKHLPQYRRPDAANVSSLLLAAARLEPEELVFELSSDLIDDSLVVSLPSFHRATSIVLNLPSIFLRLPAGAEFPALETLSLLRCTADIDSLLSCCPRLRTLRLFCVKCDLRVNSSSLQELVACRWECSTDRVNIVAPMLKKLTMSLIASEVSISILAPVMEKVSWGWCYTGVSMMFGLWLLQRVTLHLSSLHIHACVIPLILYGEEDTFTHEIEKHMIAEFSVLELHLTTKGHVFGALAFHLLGINRICSAMQRLKVVLQRSTEECTLLCPCELRGWRSKTISLTALEEVEINGFKGDNHELDFLKLIFRCAPMLKRMTVNLSDKASTSNHSRKKLYNIFRASSSVECYVYLSSGSMHGSHNCPST